MDNSEINSSLGYSKPPWVFKGSALYQLHLVKAETARAFIPKEFRLVEAFGWYYVLYKYTLGGFFLANYEDSTAGIFDELVVLAGIVWNPPTSCAWAARVLVNSDKACLHGQKAVGLPSRVANFTKMGFNLNAYTPIGISNSESVRAVPVTKRSRFGGFLSKIGITDPPESMMNCLDVQVKETDNRTGMDLCSIKLTAAASQNDSGRWMGPEIKMSLPSFSGRTEYNLHLLKYSCQIQCRVRAVSPTQVHGPSASSMDGEISSETESPTGDDKRNLSISVMLSKPILALQFNCLQMKVEAPTIVQG